MITLFALPSVAQQQGGSTNLTGCLSGPNEEGVYVLNTSSGAIEVGGSPELKNHVGHEIRVSGKQTSSSEIGEKEENEAREKKEQPEAGERHFKVSKIEMVSSKCTTTK